MFSAWQGSLAFIPTWSSCLPHEFLVSSKAFLCRKATQLPLTLVTISYHESSTQQILSHEASTVSLCFTQGCACVRGSAQSKQIRSLQDLYALWQGSARLCFYKVSSKHPPTKLGSMHTLEDQRTLLATLHPKRPSVSKPAHQPSSNKQFGEPAGQRNIPESQEYDLTKQTWEMKKQNALTIVFSQCHTPGMEDSGSLECSGMAEGHHALGDSCVHVFSFHVPFVG